MVAQPHSAIEGSMPAKLHAIRVPAAVRADRLWRTHAVPQAWRYPLLRRLLACADVGAALLASLSIGFAGAGDVGQLAWSLVWLPAWVVLAKVLGLYDRDERSLRHTTIDETLYLVLLALIGTSLLSLFLVLTPAGRPDASRTFVVGVIAAVALFSLRALVRFIWRWVTPPERIAIVGSAATTGALKRKLELFGGLHATIVEEHEALDFEGRRASEVLETVDRLVYAPSSLGNTQMRRALELAHATGSLLTVVPPCWDVFKPGVRLNHLAELPVLEYRTPDPSPSTIFLKRTTDVLVSGAALVILFPLFVLIAAAIKLDSRGPVVFSQVRAGVEGRPFRMFKFRSMVVDAEDLLHNLVSLDGLSEPMFKLHDDPRVTRLGRILRRWSLDELPQLWNVLVGQMSVVGPRPEQLEVVEHYKPEHCHRLAVKPGITGPMQVHGRGELTFAERLAIEGDYIENISIGRDLRIMVMTIPAALSGKGAF
jgi:exopolysaccharide biosynthesis polyprenyl glycosylphosphotransferase